MSWNGFYKKKKEVKDITRVEIWVFVICRIKELKDLHDLKKLLVKISACHTFVHIIFCTDFKKEKLFFYFDVVDMCSVLIVMVNDGK